MTAQSAHQVGGADGSNWLCDWGKQQVAGGGVWVFDRSGASLSACQSVRYTGF